MDAQVYYSTLINLSGSLVPESNLCILRGMLKTTMIPEQVNLPYGQLLAGASTEVQVTGVGQDSYEPPHSDRGGDGPVGQQTFNQVLGPIRAALAGTRARFPNLCIAEILAVTSPLIKYSAIKLGPDGVCLDMLRLGQCKEPGCTYTHLFTHIFLDSA
jgi:hypothetical protein